MTLTTYKGRGDDGCQSGRSYRDSYNHIKPQMEAECSLCAESLELQMKITYQSVFVGYVVGEFQFVKGDNFLHPLFSSGGAVGVNVHPLGHLRVRLPRHNPRAGNIVRVSAGIRN